MPTEIHFQISFNAKTNYKKILKAFSSNGWSLFSSEQKIFIIDKGDSYNWIDTVNLKECNTILSYKNSSNEPIGFYCYYKGNCFSFIINDKEIRGWSFEKEMYKNAENPDFNYCAKILTEPFINFRDFVNIRLSMESIGGEYDSIKFDKIELLDIIHETKRENWQQAT